MMVAFAHRFKALKAAEAQQHDQQACAFMNNALQVIGEILTLNPTITTVQVLCAMDIFLQNSSKHQSCVFLIAVAIKTAQTTGLHRHPSMATNIHKSIWSNAKRVF
jgi:hypothetical protein